MSINDLLNMIDSNNAQIKGLSAVMTCRLKGITSSLAEEINEKAWSSEKLITQIRNKLSFNITRFESERITTLETLSSGCKIVDGKMDIELNMPIDKFISLYIFESCKANGNNISHTARTLNTSTKTVRKYIDVFEFYHGKELEGKENG